MLWFHILFLGRTEGETVIFGVTDNQVLASFFSLASRSERAGTSLFRTEHSTCHRLLLGICPAVSACKLDLPHLLQCRLLWLTPAEIPEVGCSACLQNWGSALLCSHVQPRLSAQGKGTKGWTRFPLLLSAIQCLEKKGGLHFGVKKMRFLFVRAAGVPGGAHGTEHGPPGAHIFRFSHFPICKSHFYKA